MIDASHFDAKTAYAAAERHQLEDYEPHVYRTRDAGKTWQPITQGLPAGVYVQTVKEDPRRRGLLFCGTERGVFVSFDEGDHWQSLQMNLPAGSMRDLQIKDDDLIVATHGRGFWMLDDITALRQIDAAAAGADGDPVPSGGGRQAAGPERAGHAAAEGRAVGGESAERRDHRLLPEGGARRRRSRSRSSTRRARSSGAMRATIGRSRAIRTRSRCSWCGRRRRSRCRRRPACTAGCGTCAARRPRRRPVAAAAARPRRRGRSARAGLRSGSPSTARPTRSRWSSRQDPRGVFVSRLPRSGSMGACHRPAPFEAPRARAGRAEVPARDSGGAAAVGRAAGDSRRRARARAGARDLRDRDERAASRHGGPRDPRRCAGPRRTRVHASSRRRLGPHLRGLRARRRSRSSTTTSRTTSAGRRSSPRS